MKPAYHKIIWFFFVCRNVRKAAKRFVFCDDKMNLKFPLSDHTPGQAASARAAFVDFATWTHKLDHEMNVFHTHIPHTELRGAELYGKPLKTYVNNATNRRKRRVGKPHYREHHYHTCTIEAADTWWTRTYPSQTPTWHTIVQCTNNWKRVKGKREKEEKEKKTQKRLLNKMWI